jgi:DNA repair exonuclease SbcCD ATPase subunit
MTDSSEGLRDRLTRQGEDAIGKLAQELLDNPLISGAIARAFEARERAAQAQEVALGALNLPSAADVERLTRRLRSVSQRLEGIEDAVDRLDERLEKAGRAPAGEDKRLASIEAGLTKLTGELHNLARALDTGPNPPPREQERLAVDDHAEKKPPARKPAARRKPRAPKAS